METMAVYIPWCKTTGSGMSVFQRKTTKGLTKEFHYRFMKGGKKYLGVCEGCETKEVALAYEAHIKKTANELSAQRNVKALVENFRDELAVGIKIELAKAFSEAKKKPRRHSTSDFYASIKESQYDDFVSFMRKRFPDIKYISDVQKKHAEAYIAHLRAHGRFNKKIAFRNGAKEGKSSHYENKCALLSPSTINRFHKTLREVFSLLGDDAGMFANPFSSIPMMDEENESREAFSEKELEAIITKAPPFIRAIFIIGFFTALREGDISTLRWSDVLWEQGVIRRKLLKTGNIVEIPIMPPLMNFLREQLGKDKEYVLPEHAAMYLQNPSGVSYRVKRFLADELGIETSRKVPGRTRAVSVKDVHSLRHTFCYFAGVAGIPLVVVQSIVGHMTPEMTSHYTAHADRQTKREKMALIPHFSALVGETRRSNLVEQTRAAVIEKIATASDEVLNRIAAMLLPQKPRRLLLHNKALEMPK